MGENSVWCEVTRMELSDGNDIDVHATGDAKCPRCDITSDDDSRANKRHDTKIQKVLIDFCARSISRY